MIYNGKEIEFPAVMQISFYKVIESLEQMAKDADRSMANYAQKLLLEVEKHPALRDGVEDLDQLKKYKTSIQKICRVLFPDALR